MKENKFRVWSVSKVGKHGTMHHLNDGNMLKDLVGEKGWHVMQYTGLKDKNGKEVYEGDVVKGKFYDGETEISTVTWHEKSGGFTYFGYPLNIHGLHGLAIIGNIYENPELLK